ncbi:MAG TPA: hypothetical protein VJN88_01050 [Ktedonobacterales bacterium]|nr:hypothetical protein [Ktedonobacterales bacterium]
MTERGGAADADAPPSTRESPLTPAMTRALETHGDLSWHALRLIAAALTLFGLLLGGLNLLLVGAGNANDIVLVLAGAIPCFLFAALLVGVGIAARRRCLLDAIGQRYLTTFGDLRLVHTRTAAAVFTRGKARGYAIFEPDRRVVTIVNRGAAPTATLQAAVAYTPYTRYVFAVYDGRGEEVYRDPALTRDADKEMRHG